MYSIIIIIFLATMWYLNKKSKNDFFFQDKEIIFKKLEFVLQIWDDFEFSPYDKFKLRLAFAYFINHPERYNGTSVINDRWLINGLEPESVIHDYDYIMATSFKSLNRANKEYCKRLRKRNTQWFWAWGFIFCGLTIVSIFKSIKYA